MVRKALFTISLLFTLPFLSGCSLKKTPAALQINTNPVANVFVDGKLLGKTPYSGSNFSSGEVLLKLIPESTTQALVSWEGKIKLNSGVLTLIERKFSTTEGSSSGQILTLEKIKDKKSASLSVVSDPDGALIRVNDEAKGFSPLSLDKINEGDYEIVISKEGFSEEKIKAKAVMGYKLIVNVKLAETTAMGTPTPSITGSLSPTPLISPKVSPTKAAPTEAAALPKPYVLIKETPTGWLRVRLGPSTSATEAAKVNPGEKFPLLEEKSGWLKIRYSGDKEGWISGQYATKFE